MGGGCRPGQGSGWPRLSRAAAYGSLQMLSTESQQASTQPGTLTTHTPPPPPSPPAPLPQLVFALVSVGAIFLTVNVVLLGGTIGFFQSLCLLGYCLFPMDVAAIVCVTVKLMLVRWALYVFVPPLCVLSYCPSMDVAWVGAGWVLGGAGCRRRQQCVSPSSSCWSGGWAGAGWVGAAGCWLGAGRVLLAMLGCSGGCTGLRIGQGRLPQGAANALPPRVNCFASTAPAPAAHTACLMFCCCRWIVVPIMAVCWAAVHHPLLLPPLPPAAVRCRWIVVPIMIVWSSWASIPFIGGAVPANRRALAVYPLVLLYTAVGWLALIT